MCLQSSAACYMYTCGSLSCDTRKPLRARASCDNIVINFRCNITTCKPSCQMLFLKAILGEARQWKYLVRPATL